MLKLGRLPWMSRCGINITSDYGRVRCGARVRPEEEHSMSPFSLAQTNAIHLLSFLMLPSWCSNFCGTEYLSGGELSGVTGSHAGPTGAHLRSIVA